MSNESNRSSSPASPTPDAVTLTDAIQYIGGAWRRHRRPAIMMAVAVLILTAGYIVLAPKKYRSDAQVYVLLGRENTALDPTATTGKTFALNATRENEINSVLEILSSRGNFDAVIERMSPEVVLGDVALANRPEQSADGTTYVSFEPSGPTSQAHQTALTVLEKQIGLEAVRRSNIINASCVASSPELAQELLSEYLDAAIERHMRASRVSGSLEFFQQQTGDVTQHYEETAAELAVLKSRVGVTSLVERRKTLQEQLSEIETELATTEADLAESIGATDGFEQTLAELPKTSTATTTGIPEDALGAAERQMNLLALEEQELLAKFTERHPDVIAIREQRSQAKTMIAQNDGRKQQAQAANPAYVQVQTRMATEKAKIAGLIKKRDALDVERTKATQRLAELNTHEAEIAGLEEQVKVLREAAADYTKKLEQSRIDRALEVGRMSNLTVSQPATYNPKAVSPKRRVAAVVGLALAVLAALAVLVVREWNHRRHVHFA